MDEKLSWSLDLDFNEVKDGLKQASSSFDSFKRKTDDSNRSLSSLDRGLNRAGKSANSFGSKLKKALGGLTKMIGIGTLIAMTFAAISGSVDGAISRLDTMNNYTNVMENLGVNARDAETSIKWLAEGLKGLPTTLDDAVQSVQRFTSVNENVLASTDMFLSLNNAILAGGAPIDQQRSALEQLSQAYAKGKPDMFEWRAAISAMPAQMKQVALAMGFMNTEALGESLRNGTTSMNEFMMTISQLNNEGIDGMLSFEEQARNSTGGVATSIANMKTAITRGLADIMDAIGRSNIAAFFNKISAAISTTIAYIVAFINVFKSLLGIQSESKKETQGISVAGAGVASTGEEMAKGFDKGAKSIKKAKKEMERLGQLGIDNLNILDDGSSDSDPSGGGSGGGIGGGGGSIGGLGDMGTIVPDIDVSGLTKAQEVAEKFRKKLIEIKDTIVKNKVPIISALAAIGTGVALAFVVPKMAGFATLVKNFGVLKAIGATLAHAFSPVITILSGISAPMIAVIAVVMALVGAFAQLWQTNEEFREAITETWNAIAELLTTIYESVLKPIFEGLKESILHVWEGGLKPLWDRWVEFIGSIVIEIAKLLTALQPVFKFIVEVFGPVVADAFRSLFQAIALVVNMILETLGTMLAYIGEIVAGVIQVIRGIIDFLVGVFTGDWQKALDGIVAIFEGLFRSITAVIGLIIEGFMSIVKFLGTVFVAGITIALTSVLSVFKNIFGAIFNVVKGVFDKIINLFSKGGKIFDGIKDGIANVFKTIVNAMISGINKVIAIPFESLRNILANIQAISVLGVKPFSWLNPNSIPIPKIPQFADGGIVSGRVIGEIGEYANARSNPEVISPLDKLKTMINDPQTTAEQNSLLREQNRLLKKIADKDNDTYLDGQKVNKSLNRQKRREARMKGKELSYT